MPATNTTKLGRDLVPGDVLIYGSTSFTITSFDPHPGLLYEGQLCTARIAVCTDRFAMTVFDDDPIPVVAIDKSPKRRR